MYGIWHTVEKIKSAYTERRSQPCGHNQNLEGTFHYCNVNQETGKRVYYTSKVFTMPERYTVTMKSRMVKYFGLKMLEIKTKEKMMTAICNRPLV